MVRNTLSNARVGVLLSLLVGALALAGCGDEEAGADATPDTGGEDTTADSGADVEGSDLPDATEETTPEPEAPAPRSLPLPAAGCPTLAPGAVTWTAGEMARRVDVFEPSTMRGDLSLLFLWHGAGDSAANFAGAMQAQRLADDWNAIVAVPHSRGASLLEWAIFRTEDPALDLVVFDELVACAIDSYGVNPRRVYTSGFSAGGLWSTRLLLERSDVLAAAVIFSGGTANNIVAYKTPAMQTPVLAVHGGESDVVTIARFGPMTEELTTRLAADGHVTVMCDHGRGHTIPFAPALFAWPFLFDHVYGQADSPYADALNGAWPDYCQIVR